MDSAPSTFVGNQQLFPFRKLPPELRIMVWRATMLPRTVEIYTWRGGDGMEEYRCRHTNRRAPPAILHVNRESRYEGLRCYRTILENSCNVWFNYDLDILYFSSTTPCNAFEVAAFLSDNKYDGLLEVQSFAFDDDGRCINSTTPDARDDPFAKGSHLKFRFLSTALPSATALVLVMVERSATQIRPPSLTLNSNLTLMEEANDWYMISKQTSSAARRFYLHVTDGWEREILSAAKKTNWGDPWVLEVARAAIKAKMIEPWPELVTIPPNHKPWASHPQLYVLGRVML